MLNAYVYTAPNGLKGFDANSVVSRNDAEAFYAVGYRFAVRYVRRSQKHEYDLTAREARDILAAGLGLMVVQHVAPRAGLRARDQGSSMDLPPQKKRKPLAFLLVSPSGAISRV